MSDETISDVLKFGVACAIRELLGYRPVGGIEVPATRTVIIQATIVGYNGDGNVRLKFG